ncbi:MAG: GNAT family N-acetyltransferase, partial [Bacteroidota bacterium]
LCYDVWIRLIHASEQGKCMGDSDKTLLQILHLQQLNLPQAISETELQQEGFVTVSHTLSLLRRMNEPYPHIIAKEKGTVIGYALVMLRTLDQEIPILQPMFREIHTIEYKGQLLADTPYFVMGQVCIAKAFRGKGLFAGLYQHMRQEMSPHFRYLVTEVAKRNPRSMRAHEKVGFQAVKEYESGGEDWVILLWDWA